MPHVTIYTDGACSGNPGPGGWAAILCCGDHKRTVSGNARETTSNRMELTAVIKGVAALKFPCEVVIFTDSQYVIGVLSKDWRIKANHNLIRYAQTAMQEHQVSFQHVRGHSGNPGNEAANAEAQRQVKLVKARLVAARNPAIAQQLLAEATA